MAHGIMRGQFMFNNGRKKLLVLAVLALVVEANVCFAADTGMAVVNTADLPINVANNAAEKKTETTKEPQAVLVSPTKAQTGNAAITEPSTAKDETKPALAQPQAQATAKNETKPALAQPQAVEQPAPEAADVLKEPLAGASSAELPSTDGDFSFDLKMKSINAPKPLDSAKDEAKDGVEVKEEQQKAAITDADLPKEIQYKVDTMDNLGNSILSQMDGDLFSQMSEIEKSTTLLTLELRREKIRNEIEAQKAIRQKNIDDQKRKEAEEKLKELEKEKQIEARVLQEKQILRDKEKVLEILKQRKLLNAYMNQMLVTEQTWLKEKEALYAQLAQAEEEKKELVKMFKARIDKVLEASQKNIQVAESARANFERIVKGLKARNEQLRKRVEADAKIIKNAKNSLYLKSLSIEELKTKNAAMNISAIADANANATAAIEEAEQTDEIKEQEPEPKLSAQYAILGITGRSGIMSVEVIDTKGQSLSLKVGSPLPTGHVVSEIGSDYAKFSRDGSDDYLYVGKTIDGVEPTLGLIDNSKK